MKTFAFTTILAALAAKSLAAPALDSRVFDVSIVFYGSDTSCNFTQQFPADNSLVPVDNPLVVASIYSVGGGFCSFRGADGANPFISGATAGQTVDVDPPQQIVSGSCQTA